MKVFIGEDAIAYARSHREDEDYQSLLEVGNTREVVLAVKSFLSVMEEVMADPEITQRLKGLYSVLQKIDSLRCTVFL